MNVMQSDVHAFLIKHLGADPNAPDWPNSTGIYNKWQLIQEEYIELARAVGIRMAVNYDEMRFDRTAVVKELCDLLYVIFNMFEELHLDAQPFFDAVHASNMTKTPAALSPNKKILKGPDYVPPPIAEMLAKLKPAQTST